MLQLFNPIALYAIAALSIPLMIHLWNIRPGKTLKVGSIALISQASRKSSRSLKIVDVLLFILRCLLLLLLAFLLAQPFWLLKPKAGPVSGWILLPANHTAAAYRHFKTQIDSLSKAGYQWHYFHNDFAPISPAGVQQLQSGKFLDSGSNTNLAYWPLLQLLAKKVPATLPVFLYSPNRLSNFKGFNRPQTRLNLHWQTYTPADSTSSLISKAWLSGASGDIRVQNEKSSPQGTVWAYQILQGADKSSLGYQVSFNNGLPLISMKNDQSGQNNQPIEVDTSSLNIAVYADKGSDDARYLLAALNAVKQFTQRKINIASTTADVHLPGHPDWIFWLRQRRIPMVLAEHIKNVLMYRPGQSQDVSSILTIDQREQGFLFKRTAWDNDLNARSLWVDAYGNPVLTIRGNQAHDYYFYSRFNPDWNNLVWDDNFPAIIMNLLFSDEQQNGDSKNRPDKRAIDIKQILPESRTDIKADEYIALTVPLDLSKACWIAIVLLFFTERWLAHRTKTNINYASK